MKKSFLIILISFLIIGGLVFFLLSPKNNSEITENEMMYEIYPDTDQPPVLELNWDELLPEQVTRTTPYGCWEDWVEFDEGVAYEPAPEMQFYTTTGRTPIRAVASGTVVQVEDNGNNIGFLTITYGRNYSVTYHHLELIGIEPGDIIESGDTIGYGEIRGNETWWEIEFNARRGDNVMSVPPYDYFSQKSKKQLDEILETSHWDERFGERTWTVTEGCSWVKYFPTTEWVSSPIRLGIAKDGISVEEFLRLNGLDWKVVDDGRVIGPIDEC